MEDEKITNAVNTLADAIGEQEPRAAEALGAALFLVERFLTDLGRLANAMEKLSDCADGVHPSAFRVIRQDS